MCSVCATDRNDQQLTNQPGMTGLFYSRNERTDTMTFDLNTIISAAITSAIAEAIKPLSDRIDALGADLNGMTKQLAAPGLQADPALAEKLQQIEARLADITTASDQRISNVATLVAEQVLQNHNDTYDHDEYDSAASVMSEYDFNEFLTEGDIEGKVSDAVSNLSFEVSVS